MKAERSGSVEGQRPRIIREQKAIVTRKRETSEEQPLRSDDIHARVAACAYSLYEQRGYEDGYDREDWLEAERRVLSELPWAVSSDDRARKMTDAPSRRGF